MAKQRPQHPQRRGGWEKVSGWYGKIVGEKGHYYHRQVIMPNVQRLLMLKDCECFKLVDLACGQGVLARQLPRQVEYWGLDLSKSLIKAAKAGAKGKKQHKFVVGDATKRHSELPSDADWVTIILALQDIEHADKALKQAASYLKPGGRLLLVINHPCFRIPRQSHWGVDEKKKLQYRRLDSYLSQRAIPIRTEPSKEQLSPVVHSHHRPLSCYFQWLNEAGFAVEQMEEWVSDKKSTGSKAAMEDRARKEFPLFLALVAQKMAIEG